MLDPVATQSFLTFPWGVYFSVLGYLSCTWFLPCFKAACIVPDSSSKINILVSICSAISWKRYELAWSNWSCLQSEKDDTASLCTVVHVQKCFFFSLSTRKQAKMFQNCICWMKVQIVLETLACKFKPLHNVQASFPFLSLYHWHQECTGYLFKRRTDTKPFRELQPELQTEA